jgi:hypothetical protein
MPLFVTFIMFNIYSYNTIIHALIPRIGLGPALQEADALQTELRRTLTELCRTLTELLYAAP